MATLRTYPRRDGVFVVATKLRDDDVLALSICDQKAALDELGCQVVDGKIVALPVCPDCGGAGGGCVDTEEGCVELACVACGGDGVRVAA